MSAFLEEYRGYKGRISYSPEDGCFFGEIQDIPDLILYDGESLEQLEMNFREAVDDYIDNAEKEDRKAHKPCSGTFNVRIGKDLHTALARIASEQDRTLNSLVKDFCERGVNNYETGTSRLSFTGIPVQPNRPSPLSLRPNNAKFSSHDYDYSYPSQSIS